MYKRLVTHNPELAEQYATRIVNLADGVIRSDSDPFDPAPEDIRASKKQVLSLIHISLAADGRAFISPIAFNVILTLRVQRLPR